MNIADKNRIVARIVAIKLKDGKTHKGSRWLISRKGSAYFCYDLQKGGRGYIIAKLKPKKDRKEIRDYNQKYKNWIWYR